MQVTGTFVVDWGGQQHIVQGTDLDFEVIETGEGSMGPSRTHEATYPLEDGNGNSCEVTVTVEEYPLEARDSHQIKFEDPHAQLVADNLVFSFKG
jgi:hypothetical protein